MKSNKSHKGEGHRQRLRERFMNSGLSGFHDYEVIELLLTLGTPRKDCKETAKKLMTHFKTLPGVLEASFNELNKIDGVGPKNQLGVKLVKAVADRYLEKKMTKKYSVNNSKELYDYLNLHLGNKGRECFDVIFLDAKNNILGTKTLFEGTLTASPVYPREVIISALENKAAALIFAHNHPSGDTHPSEEDIAITRDLVFASRLLGITVHEHLIIGVNSFFSFADQGLIKKMNVEYSDQYNQIHQ